MVFLLNGTVQNAIFTAAFSIIVSRAKLSIKSNQFRLLENQENLVNIIDLGDSVGRDRELPHLTAFGRNSLDLNINKKMNFMLSSRLDTTSKDFIFMKKRST